MKNLVIDIGNTAVKYVVFDEDMAVWELSGAKDDASGLNAACLENKIDRMIVSAVALPGTALKEALNSFKAKLLWMSPDTLIPVRNLYETPRTLGSDRLAGVVGASVRFPEQNILVIDAGTCITYDWIDFKGNYQGGNIAPGLNMRLQAMHEHTDLLPRVKAETGMPKRLLGRSTEESMYNGVTWGLKAEMEGYLYRLQKECPEMKAILTGGDCLRLKEFINETCVVVDELLVARGLNRILTYNEN